MDTGTTISVVALIVSAGSALFTYMQARSARHQVEIARQDRHDAQRPIVRARYHRPENGGHEVITFINEGPVDIKDGVLTLGTGGHQMIKSIGGSSTIEHFAWPVGSGESYVAIRARPDAGVATFQLSCSNITGNRWSVAVTCDIPEYQAPNL